MPNPFRIFLGGAASAFPFAVHAVTVPRPIFAGATTTLMVLIGIALVGFIINRRK